MLSIKVLCILQYYFNMRKFLENTFRLHQFKGCKIKLSRNLISSPQSCKLNCFYIDLLGKVKLDTNISIYLFFFIKDKGT